MKETFSGKMFSETFCSKTLSLELSQIDITENERIQVF